jgi:hypothetical protein
MPRVFEVACYHNLKVICNIVKHFEHTSSLLATLVVVNISWRERTSQLSCLAPTFAFPRELRRIYPDEDGTFLLHCRSHSSVDKIFERKHHAKEEKKVDVKMEAANNSHVVASASVLHLHRLLLI